MSEQSSPSVKPSNAAVIESVRTRGIIKSERHSTIVPRYGEVFRNGDVIRLELPSQAWLDPAQSFFTMRTNLYAGVNSVGIDGKGNKTQWAVDPTEANPFHRFPHRATYPTRTTGPGATCTIKPGVQSLFNRVRILSGSEVLEDITDYNLLSRLMMDMTSTEEWRSTDGFVTEGYYDPSNQDQFFANANFHSNTQSMWEGVNRNSGHYYTFRPMLGLLNSGKLLPLKFIPQLTFEFYLEHSQDCLWSTSSVHDSAANRTSFPNVLDTAMQTGAKPVNSMIPDNLQAQIVNTEDTLSHQMIFSTTDSTTVTAARADFPNAYYVIDEFRYHARMVYPNKEYESAIEREITNHGLEIHHSTYSGHLRVLQTMGRHNVGIQERAESVKRMFAVMRNSPTFGDNRFDYCFPANGIENYRWQIGSEKIPAEAVICKDGPSLALTQLQRTLRTYNRKDATHNLQPAAFLSEYTIPQLDTRNLDELRRQTGEPSKFVMALDLERTAGQMSGFDSSTSAVDIELEFNLRAHSELVHAGALVDVSFQHGFNSENKTYHNTCAETSQWQPSKFRCFNPTDIGFIGRGATTANVNERNRNAVDPVTSNVWANSQIVPPNVTQPGDVTMWVDDIADNGSHGNDITYMTSATPNCYGGGMATKGVTWSNHVETLAGSLAATAIETTPFAFTATGSTALLTSVAYPLTYAALNEAYVSARAGTGYAHIRITEAVTLLTYTFTVYYVKVTGAVSGFYLYVVPRLMFEAGTTYPDKLINYEGMSVANIRIVASTTVGEIKKFDPVTAKANIDEGSTKDHARLHIWAHVDQVLKIEKIGRLQINR